MKRIDFFVNGDATIGGSVEVIGVVTHGLPVPKVIPLRYNDAPIQLPLIDGEVRMNVDFLTASSVTLAPAETWEGNRLVIEATGPTVETVLVPLEPPDLVIVEPVEQAEPVVSKEPDEPAN